MTQAYIYPTGNQYFVPGNSPGIVQGPSTTIFENIGEPLLNMATKVVFWGVDGSFWNLAGNYAGREGLTLAPKISGFMHTPFTSIFSEGPYQIGAYYERTDYKKRLINLGVQVNTDTIPADSWTYRRLEQAWGHAWSPSQTGYLGCYTRQSGWRWLMVQLAEEPKTPLEYDPIQAGKDDGFMQWDMQIVACQPFWSKKIQVQEWQNNEPTISTPWEVIESLLAGLVTYVEGVIQAGINLFLGDVLVGSGGTLQPGVDVAEGYISIWNNGDFAAWPKFLVSAPGRAWIQDGIGGPMIPMPLLTAADGPLLVDTDPTARTLTCATDPQDPIFMQILSNSEIFDILFNNLVTADEPVWKRGEVHFSTPTPVSSTAPATFKVYHSDPTGSITCFMPQAFDKAYA